MAKILIIEDDKKLRTELKIFLEKNGYQVVTVSQLLYKENYFIDSNGTQREQTIS